MYTRAHTHTCVYTCIYTRAYRRLRCQLRDRLGDRSAAAIHIAATGLARPCDSKRNNSFNIRTTGCTFTGVSGEYLCRRVHFGVLRRLFAYLKAENKENRVNLRGV